MQTRKVTCDGEKGSKRIGEVSGVGGRWYWRCVVFPTCDNSGLGSFFTQRWLLRARLRLQSVPLSGFHSVSVTAVDELFADASAALMIFGSFVSDVSPRSTYSSFTAGLLPTALKQSCLTV